MRIPNIIYWNNFLETITQHSRSKQESCAWIFAEIHQYPNRYDDIWYVFEVKNDGLKYFGETREEAMRYSFRPNKKDFEKVKRKARKLKLTRIGNVHTHVVIGNDIEELEYQLNPSETDLLYARKFNDIIRAVIVVHFPDPEKKGILFGIAWFDQYGKILRKRKFQ